MGKFKYNPFTRKLDRVDDSGGSGDMEKSTYDTDTDGIVDASEVLYDGTNTVTAEEVRDFLDAGDGFTIVAGRNANVTDVYLRGPDRVPTNLAGFVVPFDATIVGIGVATTDAESWTAEIRKNGSATVIASLVVSAAATDYDGTVDVDTDAGDELQVYCNGTDINRPSVTMFLKRR